MFILLSDKEKKEGNVVLKRDVSKKRILCAAMIISMFSALFTGCKNAEIQQNRYEKELVGKWAYVHDTGKVAAAFASDGSVRYEGKKYTYSADGDCLTLESGKGEEKKLKYVQNGDKMYIYVQSLYRLQENGKSGTVCGVWKSDENWTYEFTEKGTFMEDGALTGYYFVDEETGTIKLAYGEALEDTIMYYTLTDEGLFIEYPWMMIKAE